MDSHGFECQCRPQVFQSPRNFPRRSEPKSYGWNHISWLHGSTLKPRNFPRRSEPKSYGWNHISWLHGSTLKLQLCIEYGREMCLQWGVQKNVWDTRWHADMWWVLYWTNTTKTKGSNGPNGPGHEEAGYQRN
jgi:hypothetical protein